MLVRDLDEFFLKVNANNDPVDVELLRPIEKNPQFQDKEEELSLHHISILLNLFSRRWHRRHDKIYDDLIMGNLGPHLPYIELAKQLKVESGKTNFLSILIPTYPADKEDIEFSLLYIEEEKECKDLNKVFNDLKNNSTACTIKALQRLRERKQSYMQAEKIETDRKLQQISYWDYLETQIMPRWQSSQAKLPYRSVYLLLGFIEAYVNQSQWLNITFSDLVLYLSNEKVEDINYFYSVPISTSKRKTILSIILDCLCNKAEQEDLMALIRWLSLYDHSLITKTECFFQVYKEEKIGPYFDIDRFREQFSIIAKDIPYEIKEFKKNIDNTYSYSERLTELVNQLTLLLNEAKSIEKKHIDLIKDIYSVRYAIIRDTKFDYLRDLAPGINKKWLVLAQYLEGAEQVETWYHLLLGLDNSIQAKTDIINQEVITSYPLSYYILAEDNQYLILLPNIFAFYNRSGILYNVNLNPHRELANLELSRLEFADKTLIQKYNDEKIAKAQLCIKGKTLAQVTEFIEKAFYVEGLNENYNEEQKKIAEDAWFNFCQFYFKLEQEDIEEKKALDAQQLYFNGKLTTFYKILSDLYKKECVSIKSLDIYNLVKTYGKKTIPRIENSALAKTVLGWADNTEKKTLKQDVSNEEARRRLLILMASLFTERFNTTTKAHKINFHNYSNGVSNTGKQIYDHIKLFLDPIYMQPSVSSQTLYYYIYDVIIKNAVNAPYLKSFFRRETTKNWLNSLLNESFFKEDKYFDPRIIFIAIYKLYTNKTDVLIKLKECCGQPTSDNVKWVIFNIELGNLLNSLDEEQQSTLFFHLRMTRAQKEFEIESTFKDCISIFSMELSKKSKPVEKRRALSTPQFFSPTDEKNKRLERLDLIQLAKEDSILVY